MDSGVGGALLDGGQLVPGARGMAGEFGHMPFGSPAVRCRCGAHGCWNTALDGQALARHLGESAPADEVSYSREVLAAARAGGETRIEGAASVREVNELFGLTVPEEDYTTVGGYVFGVLGRLPVVGDRAVGGGATFIVRAMDGRRIETLALEKTKATGNS